MTTNGAAPTDDENMEPWLQLFDRLDVTLILVGGSEALRIFRTFGPRRRANAHQRLLRERQRLIFELQGIGVCPIETEESLFPGLPGAGTLDTHYELLAQAFARCAPVAQRLGKTGLRQWLLDRAHMHRQHALFLLT